MAGSTACLRLSQRRCAFVMAFIALPDGSVRRIITLHDGTLEKQEVLIRPQWQLLAARSGLGLSQGEFARAAGGSVRALQEWEQGQKNPSGARSLTKLVSLHLELLAGSD